MNLNILIYNTLFNYKCFKLNNKTGLPASGGLMAGDAFRQFVDKIMEK